jgi:glycosyltransferase involved in cell wall biosynthesis
MIDILMPVAQVSVIMSVFNGEEFLREALQSIVNQSLKEFEVIVVNDGSTDATKQIVMEFVKYDERVKFHENQENMGLPRSLNVAISKATSPLHIVMGADDILGKDYLASMCQALRETKADFLYSDYQLISGEGDLIGKSKVEDVTFLTCGMVLGVSRIWRATLFNQIGGFDPSTFVFEDYEFSVRAWKSGAKIERIGLQQFFYRIHSKQLTHTKKLPKSYYSFRYKLVIEDVANKDSNTTGRAVVTFIRTCISHRKYLWAIRAGLLVPKCLVPITFYLISKLGDSKKNIKAKQNSSAKTAK